MTIQSQENKSKGAKALLFFLLVLTIGCTSPKTVEDFVAYANGWERGDKIPMSLLKYNASECLLDPDDSLAVYDEVTNYSFLMAVIWHKDTDKEVFDLAVEKALLTKGPERFFEDVTAQFEFYTNLFKSKRHMALFNRRSDKHVWVDSLFIDFEDMKEEEAREVFSEIKQDLSTGLKWDDVYGKYMKKYMMSDGRTRLGNYGDFVVSEKKHDALPFRRVSVKKEHLPKIMQAKKKDVLVLKDKKTMYLYLIK